MTGRGSLAAVAALSLLLAVLSSASPVAAQQQDLDGDGLDDANELRIAQAFVPIFVFDEHEPVGSTEGPFQIGHYGALHGVAADGMPDVRPPVGNGYPRDSIAMLWQLSPVRAGSVPWSPGEKLHGPAAPSEHPRLMLTLVAAYTDDYVDLGDNWLFGSDATSGGSWWHYGDSERTRILLDVIGPDCYPTTAATVPLGANRGELTQACLKTGQAWFAGMAVNRHDHAQSYAREDLKWADGSDGWQHPLIYVSEGKHAGYAKKNECENAAIFSFSGVTIKENCGGGHRWEPRLIERLNVGDRGDHCPTCTPRFTHTIDRGRLGSLFPNAEEIWHTDDAIARGQAKPRRFCGGHNVDDQLRRGQNPNFSIAGMGFDDSPICAGPLDRKWYRGVTRAEPGTASVALAPVCGLTGTWQNELGWTYDLWPSGAEGTYGWTRHDWEREWAEVILSGGNVSASWWGELEDGTPFGSTAPLGGQVTSSDGDGCPTMISWENGGWFERIG